MNFKKRSYCLFLIFFIYSPITKTIASAPSLCDFSVISYLLPEVVVIDMSSKHDLRGGSSEGGYSAKIIGEDSSRRWIVKPSFDEVDEEGIRYSAFSEYLSFLVFNTLMEQIKNTELVRKLKIIYPEVRLVRVKDREGDLNFYSLQQQLDGVSSDPIIFDRGNLNSLASFQESLDFIFLIDFFSGNFDRTIFLQFSDSSRTQLESIKLHNLVATLGEGPNFEYRDLVLIDQTRAWSSFGPHSFIDNQQYHVRSLGNTWNEMIGV